MLQPLRLALGLGLAAVCATAGASWVHAQQNQPRLFLSLTDAAGMPVTDLKSNEVSLKQGGSTCLYVRAEPLNWPTRLTLMVDNGVKMADSLVELRSGLRAFFTAVPDGIELSIISLAPQPRWVMRPTTNREGLTKSIDLVVPDHGAPKLFDALMEAADRIDKDKTDNFPVIVAIASDLAEGSNAKEQDLMRMLDRLLSRPATVHVVMVTSGASQKPNIMTGAATSEITSLVVKDTGGEYTAINSTSRLASLMPDVAQRIAKSYARQSHQYRITCDRWDGAVSATAPVSLGTTRPGTRGASSFDGHLP